MNQFEQSVCQVLHGEDAALLKCFDAHALDAMATKGNDTGLFSDEKVFVRIIECKRNGELFTLR